jgi:hypothetical protein
MLVGGNLALLRASCCLQLGSLQLHLALGQEEEHQRNSYELWIEKMQVGGNLALLLRLRCHLVYRPVGQEE